MLIIIQIIVINQKYPRKLLLPPCFNERVKPKKKGKRTPKLIQRAESNDALNRMDLHSEVCTKSLKKRNCAVGVKCFLLLLVILSSLKIINKLTILQLMRHIMSRQN